MQLPPELEDAEELAPPGSGIPPEAFQKGNLDPAREPIFDAPWNDWEAEDGALEFEHLPKSHQPEAWTEAALDLNEWLAGHEGVIDAIVQDIDCEEPPCILEWSFSETSTNDSQADAQTKDAFVLEAMQQVREITGITNLALNRVTSPTGRDHVWLYATPDEVDPQGELALAIAGSIRERTAVKMRKPYLDMRGKGEDIKPDDGG
ncbi:MAG: hypothetical protein GY898_26555 [Proteobacteria bacterium]|nr:hypothetical protein [Pseudomonadota bacterium]